ncbi:hypothetical protein F4777DRAFT_554595 [Nemania sp. FL0916]|nr:hypothetical protein F4777DRAFT_554595 [Nemania sp. FL0916]
MRLSPNFFLQLLLAASTSTTSIVSAHRIFPRLRVSPNHDLNLNLNAQSPLTSMSDSSPAQAHKPGIAQAQMQQSGVLLSDVLGTSRSVNAFASFARDVASISSRLDDASTQSTVLAPLNSAIDRLPGKPWEDPGDYAAQGASVYDGDEGRERARRNIEKFVQAHVLPVTPWKEGQKVRSLLDGDREIWWERKDGVMLIQPDGIEVQSVASKVGNGEVWIIKEVRKFR